MRVRIQGEKTAEPRKSAGKRAVFALFKIMQAPATPSQPTPNTQLCDARARSLLAPSKVYWVRLAAGRSLGYRKGLHRGAWIVKRRIGGSRQELRLGLADDAAPADGRRVLSWDQAQERAWQWFAQQSDRGAAKVRGRYTVAQASADYIAYLRRNGRRSGESYAALMRRHIRERSSIGTVRVDQLTAKQIEQWRDRVARSPRRGSCTPPKQAEEERQRRASANVLLAILRAALNLARRDRASTGVRADGSAWKAVRPYRGVRRTRRRFLSLEEQRTLVDACDGATQDLVRAALYTGARFAELAALRADDVIADPPSILIAASKSGRHRHVRLEPEAATFFLSLRDRAPVGRLLPGPKGAAWTAAQARAALTRAWGKISARRYEAGQAAPSPCTFHELRHTAASRWVAAGLPMKFVAAQLGHSSTGITEQFYVHLSTEDLARAFAALAGPGLGPSDWIGHPPDPRDCLR